MRLPNFLRKIFRGPKERAVVTEQIEQVRSHQKVLAAEIRALEKKVELIRRTR